MQHNLISLFSNNKAVSKILSCCAVLLFIFVLSAPISVSALASPQLNPVYNTDIIQIEEYVNGLSSGQMDVFNILLGFYLASQAGAAKYQIEDPYVNQDGVLNWLKSCGVKFYNDFAGWLGSYDPISGIDTQKLLAIILGAAILADQYSSESDFVSDIQNSSHYFLPLDSSLQIGINQFLASNNGLYNWQFSNGTFVTNDWSYLQRNLSGTLLSEYTVAVNSLVSPVSFLSPLPIPNSYNTHYPQNAISDSLPKFNFFINTTSHQVYVVDDYGNIPSNLFFNLVCVSSSVVHTINSQLRFEYLNYNPSLFSSYSDIVNHFINYYDSFGDYLFCFNFALDGNNVFLVPMYSLFINEYYYGSDWNNKNIVNNTTDLNFNNSDSLYYDQVQNDLLIDIKGLLQDLLGTNELNKPVFDNLYDTTGQPVTDTATVNVSVNAILPDSGIFVPNNIFSPLFGDDNNGYIWYLWQMTKPLVLYTKDFLNTLLFDGNGVAWIVYGVVSVGIVGGLIVKFLL